MLPAGEDISQEARDSVAAGFRWRIRCTCENLGSNPVEELQDELKRTVGFYGENFISHLLVHDPSDPAFDISGTYIVNMQNTD